MADEVLYDLVLMEMVNVMYDSSGTDEDKKIGLSKLELLGFRVGQNVVERLTKDLPRFKDELDIMKFVCKDFWSALFKKQIDNLRTNHQGMFVLQENRFKSLAQMSNNKQYIECAPQYLAFPCGLIRGALSNFGITSVVTVDINTMPCCKFQIQIQR